jgi:autotransporter-associated beta strand protein
MLEQGLVFVAPRGARSCRRSSPFRSRAKNIVPVAAFEWRPKSRKRYVEHFRKRSVTLREAVPCPIRVRGAADDTTTAGSASITGGVPGSVDEFDGGFIKFYGSSTAGDATITSLFESNIEFHDSARAGNATLVAESHGFIFFQDTTSADHAIILVENGGELNFSPIFPGCGCTGGESTAEHATITNNGITSFYRDSTAGSATIITNNGGVTSFYSRSTGGTAALFTNAGGVVDISGLGLSHDDSGNPPANVPGMTVGSIAGGGIYFLGSKQLIVGSNNLSTTVSGAIEDGGQDGGAGGSLIKVGVGVLTLTGVNPYTGGTTVSGGALVVGDFEHPSAALSGGVINTFLGGDGSPSDRLVVNGGGATGNTSVQVTNVGGPGTLTTANGIQVVSAVSYPEHSESRWRGHPGQA